MNKIQRNAFIWGVLTRIKNGGFMEDDIIDNLKDKSLIAIMEREFKEFPLVLEGETDE